MRFAFSIFAEKNARAGFRLAVMLCYTLAVCYGTLHHAMWEDEADTWIITRNASLHDFLNNFSYAGHPPLWYLLVMPLARAGLPIEYQQILNLSLSLGMAWMVIYRSPFSLWLQVLFLFSMGTVFQYAVAQRGYMLMTALMFLVAWRYPARMGQPRLYGLLLALLVNSEVFISLPAGLLMLGFLLDCRKNGKGLGVMAIPILGGLVAVASLLPWDGLDYMQGSYRVRSFMWGNFQHLVGYAFVPDELWGLVTGMNASWADFCRALPGYAVLAFTAWYLRGSRWLWFYGSCLLTVYGIFTFVTVGHWWNSYVIVGDVMWALWLFRSSGEEAGVRFRPGGYGLALSLACGLLVSDVAAIKAYRSSFPYSGGRDMALYMREEGYDRDVITSIACVNTLSVMGYVPDTMFWLVGQERTANYYMWGWYHDHCYEKYGQITDDIVAAAKEHDVLLVRKWTGPLVVPAGVRATLLHSSQGFMETLELYRLQADD